jgi:hypothetical protein
MPFRSNKATMHELKLRRLLEHNIRLREECARPRIPVSAAAGRYVCPSLDFKNVRDRALQGYSVEQGFLDKH